MKMIVDVTVARPTSQGLSFRVLGVRVTCSSVPVPGSCVSGSRVPDPGSQVLILDYDNFKNALLLQNTSDGCLWQLFKLHFPFNFCRDH